MGSLRCWLEGSVLGLFCSLVQSQAPGLEVLPATRSFTERPIVPAAVHEAATAAEGADAPRKALVLGNGAYLDLAPLRNAVQDARDVCSALGDLGFATTCRYDLQDRQAMEQAVDAFVAELGEGTAAVFYFAGHGVQLHGDNFLLPTSLRAERSEQVASEGLGLGRVLRALAAARNSPNIVILDTCRNDPFNQTPSTVPALWERGLARVEPPLGTALVYATAPGGERPSMARGATGCLPITFCAT